MIDVKDLIAHPDKYRKACIDKGYDPDLVDKTIALYAKNKAAKQEQERLRRIHKGVDWMVQEWLCQRKRLLSSARRTVRTSLTPLFQGINDESRVRY